MIEDMVIDYVTQWGILGLWTATLLLEKWKRDKRFMDLIEKNTRAINKLSSHFKKK